MGRDLLDDEFRSDCGGPGPLVLEVSGGAGGTVERRTLHRPFAVIGSDPRADVPIADQAISNHQVYIQVMARAAFWVDLESRTGVRQGGSTECSGWLGRGDSIGLGPFRVRLVEGVGADPAGARSRPSPLSTRSADGKGWPSLALALDTGTRSGSRVIPVRRALTLMGRSPACRIRFRGDEISRFHAALVRTPGHIWVVDLLSRTGIRVNGVPIRWGRLEAGDRLHLGPLRLKVLRGDADGPPAMLALPSPAATRAPLVLGSDGQPPAPYELIGDRPEPLLWHLSQLQQEMCDEFEGIIRTVVGVIGRNHRDNLALFHAELEQLREIVKELSGFASRSLAAPLGGDAGAAEGGLAPATGPRHEEFASASSSIDADLHLLLSRRISDLRREQKGRWQAVFDRWKGVGSPNGKAGEAPSATSPTNGTATDDPGEPS
jgi:pSer/pThr/pTyr-binding forkhead associated (FHA) protein